MLSLFLCVGCGQTKKATHLEVLCPTGAPSLAFLNAKQASLTFTEGSDGLVASLGNPSSSYDMIVAPINLGMKMIADGQTDYVLEGVLTWGNLYLVGTKEALTKEGTIALFGQGAVPGKIYDASKINTNLTPNYLGSAQMVSAALLSEQAQVGMLAEPLASATIEKAKKQGLSLTIIEDLQKQYQMANDKETYGYPQAAIFVKAGVDASLLIEEIQEDIESGMPHLEENIDAIGAETLGLPNAKIVLKTLTQQNIHYVPKEACAKDIQDFLSLFDIDYEA